MGISINIAIRLAVIAPLLEGCENGLMLGRQKMHFRPKGWTPRLIRNLRRLRINATPEDIFQPDGFCETYLNTIGWPKMESMDFSDIEGAEYIHDLGVPVGEELHNKFDLIYDGGTTEHVFDIAQTFRNADAMLKDGGFFISCVGSDGWFGHGFYQVGPDIPWRYWHHSLGYEVIACWTFTRQGVEDPVHIEDPTGIPGGAYRQHKEPVFLFYMVQKKPRSGPPGPVIQGHYVDY